MASCLLLNLLPPELRLQIYSHILVRPLDHVGALVVTAKKSQTAKHASRTVIFRTCRQIYNEAYPILLSANTWVTRPSREDYEWLFGLGLRGQVSLRTIIFDCGYYYGGLWPETFFFEMLNTLSSPTRLSLTIKVSTIRLLRLYKNDTMKYLHGFARATMDDLVHGHKSCQRHGDLPTKLPHHLFALRNRTWKGLLDHLMSPCPDECAMHVGRRAPHTQSAVHLSLTHTCFYCEQEFELYQRYGVGLVLPAAKLGG